MKRIIALVPTVILLATLGCSASIRMSYLPDTNLGAFPAVDVEKLSAQYPGKEGVYLNRSNIYEHVTEDVMGHVSWTFLEVHDRTYVVLDPNAQWLTTFEVAAGPHQELENVSLSIRNPDGSVRRYGMEHLRPEKDSSGNTKFKFVYGDVKKGSVIREGMVLKQPNAFTRFPVSIEVPLQFSIPCQKASFSYLYPSWWTHKVKALGPNRTLTLVKSSDKNAKKTILRYTAQDIPAIEKEPYAPFFKEVANYAQLQITSLTLGNRYYNAPGNWEKFASEFKDYAMDRDPIFSDRVRVLTKEVTWGCKSKSEELEAIVAWVQNNMEIGDGGRNFAEMVKNRRGNVLHLVGLSLSMLRQNGIPGRYVLIHSAQDGFFDKDFLSHSEMYIPAAVVEADGRSYLVFPYVKGLPITHVPEQYVGQDALVIGADGKHELIKVPQGNLATNEVSEDYTLQVQEDGRIHVTEEKVLTGSNAFHARQVLKNLNKDETEKVLRNLLTYTEGEVKFKEYAFVDQADAKKPLKVRLSYTIDNLVTVTPEEVVFQTGGLFAPASHQKTKVDPKSRQNPVRIYYDESHRKRIALIVPKGWSLASRLEDVKVENGFGSVRSTYKVDGSHIQVDQQLLLKAATEGKEQLPELLALTGKRSKLQVPTLVFRRKP